MQVVVMRVMMMAMMTTIISRRSSDCTNVQCSMTSIPLKNVANQHLADANHVNHTYLVLPMLLSRGDHLHLRGQGGLDEAPSSIRL